MPTTARAARRAIRLFMDFSFGWSEGETSQRGGEIRFAELSDGLSAAFGGIALTAASRIARAGLEFADEAHGLRLGHAGCAQPSFDTPCDRRCRLAVALLDLVRGQETVGKPFVDCCLSTNPCFGIHQLCHGL